MFGRLVSIQRQALIAATRKSRFMPLASVARCNYHQDHHHDDDSHIVKFDEFPVPSGSWHEAYEKLQSKYNKQLIASLIYFASAIAFYLIYQPVDFGLPPNKKEFEEWAQKNPIPGYPKD